MKQSIIDCVIFNYNNSDIVFKDLREKSLIAKNKINDCNRWEYLKKISNDYENIYTTNKKYSLCLKTPISRSYFKLCEIINDCQLNKKYKDVLCIAEAPGGFVEFLCEHELCEDIYLNTFIKNDKNIPLWNYNCLKKYENIKYTHDANNNGDLKNINNIKTLHKYKNCFELITADGGIDFSLNFNNQELDSYELIYSEIYSALIYQKNKGILIIKFFDLFYQNTIKLLYILKQCYETITFIKPYTSRPSNSEKYLVCKNYNKNSNIIELMELYWGKKQNIYINIDYNFYKIVYDYNKTFTENQINSIENTIKKIHKTDSEKKKLCINWLKKYNLPCKNI